MPVYGKLSLLLCTLSIIAGGCESPVVSSEARIDRCVAVYGDPGADANGLVNGEDVEGMQRDKCSRAEAEGRLTSKGGFKD